MARTPNPYSSLDDPQYDAVVNGQYVKSTFSSANGGCLSFTVSDGLIGFQDDKLPPAERKARTLIFTQHELAAFIAGAKMETSTAYSTNLPSPHLPENPHPLRGSSRTGCTAKWNHLHVDVGVPCPVAVRGSARAGDLGRLVESAVGAHLCNSATSAATEVFYWRDRGKEVDYVVRSGLAGGLRGEEWRSPGGTFRIGRVRERPS